MEPANGENTGDKSTDLANPDEPKSDLEKWIGEGKQYTPPDVTPEMVTEELFNEVYFEMQRF
jgi:hypothetical protein